MKIKRRYKVLAVIAVLITALLFAAPRVGRWYLVKHSLELTGRRIEIDKIRFNYFTATLQIKNFKMFESDSRTTFVSFNLLKINLDYLPLFKNEIYVKYIILDGLTAEILQKGDVFNFSDLMKTDSTTVKADTVPNKPVKYILNNISISKGFVKYTDQVINHTISMNNVDLNIPGFTWNSDSTRLGVDFRFVDGGRLYSNLSINQADSTYAVNLKLDSLNLDIIEPYVKNYMYISALHGYLSNDILLKGDMRSLLKLSIRGMNQIFGFQLIDTLKRTIFSFDDLAVEIDTLLPDRNRLALNQIELKKPYFYFELIDTTNNWLTLMKPSPEEKPDTLNQPSGSSDQQEKSSFRFSKLTITDGKVTVSDKTLRYPFEYNIEKIGLTSSPDIKIPGWIKVAMTAMLNGTGNFKTDFALNPEKTGDLDISLSIDQFRMKDVEPYFRHYFGFPVTGGMMKFNTQNKLRTNSLISNNSLYFRKFTLGKKSAEKVEYNIPLRLALGVMSDKDGIIDVKSPVEMKGENIKVRNLRKIIFRTIGNLFIKAAVSPVNLLGEMFKADPETLKQVDLTLTDPAPDKKNMESLDILSDILNRKPGLSLDFIYCTNPEKESDTLAHMMVYTEFARQNNLSADNSIIVPDSTLSKYLTGKIPGDSLSASTNLTGLCRKYVGEQKLKASIDSLRASQTAFLRNYLSHDKELAPERFTIIETIPDSIKYEGAIPSFRIYFNAAEGSSASKE